MSKVKGASRLLISCSAWCAHLAHPHLALWSCSAFHTDSLMEFLMLSDILLFIDMDKRTVTDEKNMSI